MVKKITVLPNFFEEADQQESSRIARIYILKFYKSRQEMFSSVILFCFSWMLVTVHQSLPGLVPGMIMIPITSTAGFRTALVWYLMLETLTLILRVSRVLQEDPVLLSLSLMCHLTHTVLWGMFNLVPRVCVPYCAGLMKRATVESSVTRSILIGLKDNPNNQK